MQNWYTNVFVDATVPFKLPYMQICQTDYTDSNRSSSPPKYASVLCELPKKLNAYENS